MESPEWLVSNTTQAIIRLAMMADIISYGHVVNLQKNYSQEVKLIGFAKCLGHENISLFSMYSEFHDSCLELVQVKRVAYMYMYMLGYTVARLSNTCVTKPLIIKPSLSPTSSTQFLQFTVPTSDRVHSP